MGNSAARIDVLGVLHTADEDADDGDAVIGVTETVDYTESVIDEGSDGESWSEDRYVMFVARASPSSGVN